MTTLRCVGDGFIFRVMFCTTINNPAIADGNGTSSPHMMTKRCMLLIARSNLFHLMAGPVSFVQVQELCVSCNPSTAQPWKLTLLWNSGARSWFYYSTIVLFGQTDNLSRIPSNNVVVASSSVALRGWLGSLCFTRLRLFVSSGDEEKSSSHL